MFSIFKKNNTVSLQRKYDKLMHEAYILSKANPVESLEKQKQALDIQKQILEK